jgi:hypothetical protein
MEVQDPAVVNMDQALPDGVRDRINRDEGLNNSKHKRKRGGIGVRVRTLFTSLCYNRLRGFNIHIYI